MNHHLKDRGILPVLIPVGALVVIGAVTIAMGKILLAVPKEIAVGVALAVAANIMIACTFLASRRFELAAIVPMLGIVLLPAVLGVAIANDVIKVKGGAEHGAEGPGSVFIAADNIAFDLEELEVPADTSFKLEFHNNEAEPHNVAIYESKGGNKLFGEAPYVGPKTVTWEVPAIPVGEYYFQCDVHPDMSGSVVAAQQEDEHAGEGSGQEITVGADNLEFDTSEIEISAGKATHLELDNREDQPHNIAILTGKGGDVLFRETPFIGPKKVGWDLPELEVGEYYFQCDVHPAMNGKVLVT